MHLQWESMGNATTSMWNMYFYVKNVFLNTIQYKTVIESAPNMLF